MVGALNTDFAGDDNFPMAALRADWRLRRWLRSELGVSYALGDVPAPGDAAGERSTSLATATVGIQAELPFRYLRPYAGVATGLFGRFDESGGARFVRTTQEFPVGVRVPVSSRLALRAEARFRFDQHENNTTAAKSPARRRRRATSAVCPAGRAAGRSSRGARTAGKRPVRRSRGFTSQRSRRRCHGPSCSRSPCPPPSSRSSTS
jgi:hypothetical protein